MIANWAPPEEKGKFQAVTMSSALGTLIDWSVSGYVIEYLGWHFAFYIVAIALFVNLSLWLFVVYDSPTNHPRISRQEKEFILGKLQTSTILNEQVKGSVLFID